MKKMTHPKLVAIFAHPDDETFGPGGTLALYAKTHEVTLICVTRGQAGANHSADTNGDIGTIREKELLNATAILGIDEVIFLNYEDGTLSNNQYHAIARDITDILDRIRPETLMTFEMRGVSGHIDHVAVSMIVHYVFKKIDYARELLLYCEKKAFIKEFKDYFIFMPPGYDDSEIDLVVDVSPVWEARIRAMHEHKSQIKDVKKILAILETFPKEECFLVEGK